MIMATNDDYKYFSAHSRVDGAIIGAMWIASFFCFVGEFQVPVLSFVAVALAIASVGVLVVRARKFRDNILGGEISFGKAMLYCVQTFFHSILLMAVAQYLYFQFMDHGYIINQYITMLSTPEYASVAKEVYGVEAKQLIAILQNTMTTMRPIEIAYQFLTINVIVGILISVPMAAIVRRVRA